MERAVLCIDSWVGRREVPILFLREICAPSMQRARIQLLESCLVPGRGYKQVGTVLRVPMYSIGFDDGSE